MSAAIAFDESAKAVSSSAFEGQSLMTRFEKPTLGSGTEADERLTEPTSLAPKEIPEAQMVRRPKTPTCFHRAEIDFEGNTHLSSPIAKSIFTSLTSLADRMVA